MADTIRQLIISAIESGLSSIRIKEGYQTDIGVRVEVVRSKIDKEQLPAVVIWPQVETAEKIHRKSKITMPVRVEAVLTFNPEQNPSVIIERMLGDLRKRMESLTEDITGGYGDHIEYTQGGADNYPEPGDTVAACAVVYNVVYKTIAGDPYSQ